MQLQRTLYHTSVKHLVQNSALPDELLRKIPRSNVYRWRNQDLGRYVGFSVVDDGGLLNAFANNSRARRMFACYVRVLAFVLGIAHSLKDFHSEVKKHQKQVVSIVNRVRSSITLTRLLRFFDISVATFRNWSLQSATECLHSAIGTCNKVYPNQLSRSEVSRLRALLIDERFRFWPVSSVAWYALRNNILPLSLNTWYKYVIKLGLPRERVSSRRKKADIGVRALRPHEIWHADITQFVTGDHVKHYIYLVADNFSRKILSWMVAPLVSATHRRATLDMALQNALPGGGVLLITDGGPENRFNDMEGMEHKRALIDVHYSNSLIEAHNKIIKYNYLYRKDIVNGEQLLKELPDIISDFNNRPHISLDGLTPNEAESGISLNRLQLTENIRHAALNRKLHNQANRCGQCS